MTNPIEQRDKKKDKKLLSETVWEDFEKAFGIIAEGAKNEKEPR